MRYYSILLLGLFGYQISYGQNYSIPLEGVGYLTCDELEESIVKKSKFIKGWDDYELNSSFLEKVRLYSTQRLPYNFALVKLKNNPNYYVYCGISNDDFLLFEMFVNTGESPGKMFNEYISPYKCDCK